MEKYNLIWLSDTPSKHIAKVTACAASGTYFDFTAWSLQDKIKFRVLKKWRCRTQSALDHGNIHIHFWSALMFVKQTQRRG